MRKTSTYPDNPKDIIKTQRNFNDDIIDELKSLRLETVEAIETTSSSGTSYSEANNGHITILPWAYSSITQGTWTFGTSGNSWSQFVYWASSSAQNDQINYKVCLSPGTYSLRILGIKYTNRGIYTVYLDDVSVGTIDAYASSIAYNQLMSITGISITEGGLKTLSFKVATKNASSSGYVMEFGIISIWRTA